MLREEHGLSLSRETVRSWLKKAGLLNPQKHRFRRRKRRPRSPKEGQIVFFDGSLHQWFGNKPYTLLLALDDATGKAPYALFVPRETLRGYFQLAYKVFSRYGLPQNLYLDRHCVFLTTRHERVHVKQSADNPTSFQIAMAELEIGLIYAYSPQAKGRIERSIQTFQNRLVKELALKKINDPEKATLYTNKIFIPRYNRKFAVKPEEKEKAWRKPPEKLKEILSRRMSRKVKADLTISVEGKILQLKPPRLTMKLSGTRVEVRELLDGSLRVYHHTGEIIPHKEVKKDQRPCRNKTLRVKKKTYEGGDIFPLQLG